MPQSEIANTENSTIDIFISPEVRLLLKKLSRSSQPIGTICYIRQCIKTGDDGRFVKNAEIQPGKEWKRSLRGRSIERYSVGETNLWVKYGPWLARNWQNKSFYEVEKLAVRETGARMIATLDRDNRYFLSSLYSVYPKEQKSYSLRYLLGLVNSTFATWFVHLVAFGLTAGAFTKIRTNQLARLPIRYIDPADRSDTALRDKLVENVDRILAAKRRNPEAHTTAFEREIDELIYTLYGLTPEEIKLVEANSAK